VTGDELRALRYRLGLSASEWGRALGYTGKPASLRSIISRFETGERPIPPWIARLAWMYGHHGIPAHVQWKAGGEGNTYALLP
jgi:transcriptional regulator with XRE-family HTH domain